MPGGHAFACCWKLVFAFWSSISHLKLQLVSEITKILTHNYAWRHRLHTLKWWGCMSFVFGGEHRNVGHKSFWCLVIGYVLLWFLCFRVLKHPLSYGLLKHFLCEDMKTCQSMAWEDLKVHDVRFNFQGSRDLCFTKYWIKRYMGSVKMLIKM